MRRHRSVVLVLFLLTACGGSSRSPSAPDSPRALQGQAVNGVDGGAVGGVSVQVGARWPVIADSAGMFSVDLDSGGPHRVTLKSSAVVDRETSVMGPTADRIRLPLIPASFDLTAFDEMVRTANARLQRWVTRPSLVVLGSVMVYRAGAGTEFEAGAEQLSEAEVTQMVAHLTEGLALLTGETFTSFASVTVERPAAGMRINVARTGFVVAGRYSGIVTLANTIGYGQWSEMSNGAVVGGSMFLDRDFDAGDSRRRLLRIHELGHALGYLHVKTRTSIMNTHIGPEPTEFDRAAARLAFQRLPGNRAPDVDPVSSSTTLSVTGGARWMPPVFCN
jgi:hypothetical protein